MTCIMVIAIRVAFGKLLDVCMCTYTDVIYTMYVLSLHIGVLALLACVAAVYCVMKRKKGKAGLLRRVLS